ncbi:MAG TPA: hypothetical protein VFB31_03235 [Pseudolabrys sp.]|nr:hypothetical protein [Pseudolabrys sp.]
MTKQRIGRILSVLAGAATLFGLQQGLDLELYVAIPIAVIVYLAVKVGLGLWWGVGEQA